MTPSDAKWAFYAASPAYPNTLLATRPWPRPVDGGAKSVAAAAETAAEGEDSDPRLCLASSLTLGLGRALLAAPREDEQIHLGVCA